MNIWLVTIGEPVPVGEGSRDRLHRTGSFAHFLAERGHRVTWWTSTFDHFRKKHWFDEDTVLRPRDRLEIRLLHGTGYRSNLSLARIRDHRRLAARFARLARQEPVRPAIILAALPTIELSLESVRYGRQQGIPVILDMRDMWPDIFVDALPAGARPLGRAMLWPMFRAARAACRGATAITGHTEEFVEWGLRRGGRARTDRDRAFHFAYDPDAPEPSSLGRAAAFWDEKGVPAEGGPPVACFVGTIGRQFDLETVLRAARRLAAENASWRLVICGRGDRLEAYRAMARDLPGILFPGWVDAAQIHVLLRRANVGLDPLVDRYDFLATINNKAIEYLSAGLPVVSCPRRGVLADLLAREDCGISYDHGDADALASLLARIEREPERLDAMRQSALRVFHDRFTPQKVYGAMEAYLAELAAAGVRA